MGISTAIRFAAKQSVHLHNELPIGGECSPATCNSQVDVLPMRLARQFGQTLALARPLQA